MTHNSFHHQNENPCLTIGDASAALDITLLQAISWTKLLEMEGQNWPWQSGGAYPTINYTYVLDTF